MRREPIAGKGAPLQAIDYSFSTLECWKSLVCNWQRWLQYNPCIWAKYYGNRIEKLCYCVCVCHTVIIHGSWNIPGDDDWGWKLTVLDILWQGLQYCTKRPHRDHIDKSQHNVQLNHTFLRHLWRWFLIKICNHGGITKNFDFLSFYFFYGLLLKYERGTN